MTECSDDIHGTSYCKAIGLTAGMDVDLVNSYTFQRGIQLIRDSPYGGHPDCVLYHAGMHPENGLVQWYAAYEGNVLIIYRREEMDDNRIYLEDRYSLSIKEPQILSSESWYLWPKSALSWWENRPRRNS